jgi:hypothetical protein
LAGRFINYLLSLFIQEAAVAHAPVDMEGRPVSGAWRAVLLFALAILGLALVQSHPLWLHLSEGIPYGYRVVPGYELVPAMPGDHLQFLYWCWLMGDNLFGPSALFTNPYEFNTFLTPHGLPGFANFPFSLLYVLFSPLGQAPAYNILVLLSYLLAGLAAYALAAELLKDRVAALPAGVIFAILPFRAAQVLSGHLYGFVAFLLPLMLYCLERGWRRASWLWGAGAGVCLVLMGLMEPHLVYYSSLFLGLYVPLRLILFHQSREPQAGGLAEIFMVAAGGLGAGFMAHVSLARRGGELLASGLWEALGIYLAAALCLWLLLSWLATALSLLPLARARKVVAKGFLPWAGLVLYAAQLKLDLPYLGSSLLVIASAASLYLTLPKLWPHRRSLPRLGKAWLPVLPLAAGLLLAAGRMILVKLSTFDASIAGKGRGLGEVLLFTPGLGDLLNLSNPHMEKLVHLGWVLMGLAVLGLILLVLGLPRGARRACQAALWTFLAAVSALLALGPSLKALPLYALLYKIVPFFNFPRVPGRLIIFAVLMMSLLAGWVIRELSGGVKKRPAWLSAVLSLVLVAGLAWDLGLPARVGISLLPPPGPVAAGIKSHMITGPESPQRLLGLPIWPGDSHQSSIYEFTITQTRAQAVNGYSPAVPRAYISEIVRPLYNLNFGCVDNSALLTLQKLKANLVTFHDDALVYPAKISPFPPALARQRLMASGAFFYAARHGNVFLLSLKSGAGPDPAPGRIITPVTSVWEAESLPRETGELSEEKEASGWGLLFLDAVQEGKPLPARRPRAAGNVVRARAVRHKKGFLCFGPYKAFPPGRYVAAFRVRRPKDRPAADPGWVEVSADKGQRALGKLRLNGEVLPPDGTWHDVKIPFSLAVTTDLELRTFFSGREDLDLDVITVEFADSLPADGFYRAQDLWRETGELVSDRWVEGGLAVQGEAGRNPPLNLMQGPQKTYDPGRYLVSFRLARSGPAAAGKPAAHLVVATDLGLRPLADKYVASNELSEVYRDFNLKLDLKRRCELGLRVKFLGTTSLRLAGASVIPLDKEAKRPEPSADSLPGG